MDVGSTAGSVGDDLAAVLAGYQALRLAGHTDRTRVDLLSIAEVGRSELVHSAVVGWLLDPEGSHGLGAVVLDAVLHAGWGVARVGPARASLEIVHVRTRADVVVRFGARTLVVENKVDAPEDSLQCEKLFGEWGSEALYLLLSPHGRGPTSLSPEASTARLAWRGLAYAALADLLGSLRDQATGPGRGAYLDYVSTLERQFQPRRPFTIHREGPMIDPETVGGREGHAIEMQPDPFDSPRLRFYLEHASAIREIDSIRQEFKRRYDSELRDLEGPIQRSLQRTTGPVSAGLRKWGGDGPEHPLFWRPAWVGDDGEPLAAIGFGWGKGDPVTTPVFAGLFVGRGPMAARLAGLLRAHQAQTELVGGWTNGQYPVAYRNIATGDDWWHDIPAWEARVFQAVGDAWQLFARWVDDAIAEIHSASLGDQPTP